MRIFFDNHQNPDKGFEKFLKKEKLPFGNFFLIYAGGLVTCFLLGSYLEVLRFTPFRSFGNLLLAWAGWMVASYLLSGQERFERPVLHTNNLFLVWAFFWLALLSPANWVVVLLPYFIFSLLLVNFIQGNFLPSTDSLSLGLWGVLGLFFFRYGRPLVFQADPSAQLIFIFFIILSLSGASFFVWNGLRTRRALEKIYHQRKELEETAAVLEIRIKAKTRELQEQAELLREENRLKTMALRKRIEELERFRNIVVGREMKMVELKERLARTKEELSALKKKSR